MSSASDHIDRIAASARGPWSPDAFRCDHCPGDGCPAWWKEEWVRDMPDGTKERLANEGCGFRLAQGMFVRALAGNEILTQTVAVRTNEIAAKQDAQSKGIQSLMHGVLSIAAQASGNPAAIAAVPLIPRFIAAARRLLPGKKAP